MWVRYPHGVYPNIAMCRRQIVHYDRLSSVIKSHPSSIASSSSPSTSFNSQIALTSSVFTRFSMLHLPTHKTDREVCVDSRDRVWDSRRQPQLNMRSTSTDIAMVRSDFESLIQALERAHPELTGSPAPFVIIEEKWYAFHTTMILRPQHSLHRCSSNGQVLTAGR